MADYRQILRECADRLITTADRLTVNSTTDSSTSVANRSNETTSRHSDPSALEEHRRVFGFRPPVGPVQRAPSSARSSNSRGNSRKRGGGSPYFIPRNTWTRSFVCLAMKDQRTIPTASERIALTAAGLGEQKIIFNKYGNSTHVHDKIIESFPALAGAGGYEVLRVSDDKTKNLMEIPMSANGYSISYLKGTLGQAKAYIRPIQKDLSLEVSDANKEDSPLVNCVNCNLIMPMAQIRKHELECSGGSSCQPSDHTERQGIPKYFAGNKLDSDISDKDSENLKRLKILFPSSDDSTLRAALQTSSGDVNEAADFLLQVGGGSSDNATGTNGGTSGEIASVTPGTDSPAQASCHRITTSPLSDSDTDDEALLESPFLSTAEYGPNESSLTSIMKRIRRGLTGPSVKQVIDPSDIVADALAIYKHPSFDESRPLRISFEGQPAIDTGGPRREFFDQVFAKLAGGVDCSRFYKLFDGPNTRLLPVYDARIVFSGLMKCVGKMISHAIAQCEIGFPRLSPVCYWYIISQDINQAISYANISDIRDASVAEYINKSGKQPKPDCVAW